MLDRGPVARRTVRLVACCVPPAVVSRLATAALHAGRLGYISTCHNFWRLSNGDAPCMQRALTAMLDPVLVGDEAALGALTDPSRTHGWHARHAWPTVCSVSLTGSPAVTGQIAASW
jgi:hypothetical protein